LTPNILIVDDEENLCFTLQRFLSQEGYEVATAGDYEEAVSCIKKNDFDLIFSDIVLKGKTGMDILKAVKAENPLCPVVMITGVPSIESASQAVRLGAFDYLPKPVRQDAILHAARSALKHKAILEEKEKYRRNLEAIFKSVKDAIITVDRELCVLSFNQAAEKICPAFSTDLVGKQLNLTNFACLGKCIAALEQTIQHKESVELYRISCNTAKSPFHVVTASTTPLLDHRGRFSGGVLVLRDETRLADLERHLGERQQLHHIVGQSEPMQKVYSLIENLADIRSTVLITGESGTGKELIAEALHYTGCFSDQPLVKVNCAALSEHLLESELFGHVKGAFTGAVSDKMGRFQKADGGTILLDEIGEMTPRMQLYLLRVLQDMQFERVGDSTTIKVDVRVVAATNQNLAEAIKAGRFREDLYYRLKVVELTLPPLRRRTSDIPILIHHFIEHFNKKFDKQIVSVEGKVEQLFMKYRWPGNVRELKHALEHAAILCRGDCIETGHLPEEFKPEIPPDNEEDYGRTILKALEKSHWNKTDTARLLGISRQSLYRKIREYKLLGQD